MPFESNVNFVEIDFTRPGSTSQQGDLRDIQEILARDRRRVSSKYRENQHGESTTGIEKRQQGE